MAMIKFFNSYTSKKQVFRADEAKKVKIYSCGPTVYDSVHIGNLRSFMFTDMLRRFLHLEGFEINHVMNITDVDDKTIKGSILAKKSLGEFTEQHMHEFKNDLKAVRVLEPHVMPRATHNIKEMVEFIQKLMENGYAYSEAGSVYFDISKFAKYGKLSKIKLKSLKQSARTKKDSYEKDEARDFSLWKGHDSEDGDVYWSSPFGNGRPGWHIECSAMAVKYLGESIDIHTGGVDLKFPHHENEIAQCSCAGFKNFVRFWMHNEHLLVDGKKMSKSLGNYFTLKDLVDKGYDPVAFRYLCLSTHYRTQLNFTLNALAAASKTVANINSFIAKIERSKNPKGKKNVEIRAATELARSTFTKAIEDDLNTPLALSSLFDMMNVVNRCIDDGFSNEDELNEVLKFMHEFNAIFDVFISEEPLHEDDLKLVEERESARKEKNYERADHIREILKKKGIILEDTPYGVVWRRKL